MKFLFYSLIILFTFALSSDSFADENDWFVPLGLPPKAAPRRISGGESFPPLPLPATPLRRSERKRQPSPPKLVGKVVWGENATFAYKNGISRQISDWNLCPDDLQQILSKTGKQLDQPYGSEPVSLSTFHADPSKTPVLFFSGVRTLKLSKPQLAILRKYVLSGGMIIFDSIAGSPYFYNSVMNNLKLAFPEFKIRKIPPDHPLYHMIYDIDKVAYPQNLKSDQPFMEGIYVGSRIGVLISKYGMGCGWDNHHVPLLDKATYYDVNSANQLGINTVSYAIAYSAIGIEEAKPELFGSLDESIPTDELVLAQLKHEGAWNVHPGGAAALLRALRQNTAVKVNLKRRPLDPAQESLSGCTFLYLTGLDDFVLSDRAAASLKTFLKSSGTIFINSGLGLKSFDQAVKREFKKIVPNAEFVTLPPAHPIFRNVFKLTEINYTPDVLEKGQPLKTPVLEGININGELRIIYSPYDIEAGWLNCTPPKSRSILPDSAIKLGINIITYALTH
jgi:hypothetical protein